MKNVLALVLSLGIGVVAAAAADFDWPQWRGPHRDDLSRETGLLKSWPEDGPRRMWVFEQAGMGYSGPAIVAGRLYTMGTVGHDTDAEEDDHEVLICLSTEDGSQIWSTPISEVLSNAWGDGPRGTPTVDNDHVYALSGNGNLVCVQAGSGQIVWQKNLIDDLGGRRPNWGYCESVLVDGGQVVCTPGANQGALAALDKRTGDVLWRSAEFTDRAHYASIIVGTHQGKRHYIQLTGEHVVGIDPDNGDVLWTSEWPGQTAVIPTPIYSDGHVYVTSGYGVGCKLIRLTDDWQAEEVYFNKNMKNHHGGVVLLDGFLYGYSDGAGWICQDFLTGEIIWRDREGLQKGAVTYADGMLYCLDERDGTVALVKATNEGWQEQGRLSLEAQSDIRSPRGKIWTHPVVANGRLYLRDQQFISCYDISDPATGLQP